MNVIKHDIINILNINYLIFYSKIFLIQCFINMLIINIINRQFLHKNQTKNIFTKIYCF